MTTKESESKFSMQDEIKDEGEMKAFIVISNEFSESGNVGVFETLENVLNTYPNQQDFFVILQLNYGKTVNIWQYGLVIPMI